MFGRSEEHTSELGDPENMGFDVEISQITYSIAQLLLLPVWDVHFHFRLVVSVGQYHRQVHCGGRPRKHGFGLWNFVYVSNGF